MMIRGGMLGSTAGRIALASLAALLSLQPAAAQTRFTYSNGQSVSPAFDGSPANPTDTVGILRAYAEAVRAQEEAEILRAQARALEIKNRASTEGSLAIEEFDSFGPTRRTLRQFISACHDLDALVRDFLIPNPDKN